MTFALDIEAALAALGSTPSGVVDANVDPGAAVRALESDRAFVLRAAPPLAEGTEAYGPLPAAPRWLRLTPGSAEVRAIALRGGDVATFEAARVTVEETSERCCDAPSCERARTRAAVWLELKPIDPGEPDRVLVFEQRALEGEPDVAIAIAARLAKALSIQADRGGAILAASDAPGDGDGPEPLGVAVPAPDLARLSLRSEGSRVVLRDLDSRGPRASAKRNAWIGAALFGVALLGWISLARSIDAGSRSAAIASGIAAALFSLAGYAFLGVARFSARYRADSAPLLWVARDRVVVLPWVSREGAVDVRPEGRLGAAIPLHEVRAAHPKPRPEGVAVELDTDHGPIDVVLLASQDAAAAWSAAVSRVLDEARHPQKGATARQRARMRAAATT